MTGRDLERMLDDLPREIPWQDVGDSDRADERRTDVDNLYTNTIGVNVDYYEWCPNEEPPSREESLAWAWFIRPDLGAMIADEAEDDLREIIREYIASEL